MQRLTEHRCLHFNGKIIITGGSIGNEMTASTKIIDTGDDGQLRIRKVGNMTSVRASHGMGMINMDNEVKAIVFGGIGDLAGSVEIWNDIEETWSKSSLVLDVHREQFGFVTLPTELLCPKFKLKRNKK